MVTQHQRQILIPLIAAIAGVTELVQRYIDDYYEPTGTRAEDAGELEGPRWLARCAEKLLIFTHLCGHGCSFRNLRARTGRSLETIGRAVDEVLEALLKPYLTVIKPPPTDEIPVEIRNDPRRFPWFADAIGAVDGTHIPMHAPEEDIVRYRDHKSRITQNVLAVVDFKMNFT